MFWIIKLFFMAITWMKVGHIIFVCECKKCGKDYQNILFNFFYKNIIIWSNENKEKIGSNQKWQPMKFVLMQQNNNYKNKKKTIIQYFFKQPDLYVTSWFLNWSRMSSFTISYWLYYMCKRYDRLRTY